MTIRRQWMLVLVLSAALSVVINSFVLSTLINRYFVDYASENYKEHVSQLVEFSTKALSEDDYTQQQLEMQLESHLSDPINRIRLYHADGELLADVGGTDFQMMGMMRSGMMNRMMGSAAEEVDSIDIVSDGTVIGKLNITRYSSIGNSLGTRKFMLSLIGNSALSFGIVLVLMVILGLFVSKRMSRDLTLTAQQAVDVDLGRESRTPQSRVKEIKTIQQSLETLRSRLKLKQTSRKKLVDELVHQTRTPLTILRTHLEGFQDGIIQFTPEEIKTCEAQIEHLSSIITNLSGLIDAEKEISALNIAPVEVSGLIRQIVGGLKAQFEKKSIGLQVTGPQKTVVQTDLYLLSQAVYNVLTNAYKFTEPGGKVAIDYRLEGDELVIGMQDTGAGIAKEDQARVFEAYYRGKNSLNTEGEGIGLYIVRENLHKIGGSIGLESNPGAGSRFTIRIPDAPREELPGGAKPDEIVES